MWKLTLIELLPLSIDALVIKTPEHNDAMCLFIRIIWLPLKADIINMLIGPLAEANIFILPMVNHLIID